MPVWLCGSFALLIMSLRLNKPHHDLWQTELLLPQGGPLDCMTSQDVLTSSRDGVSSLVSPHVVFPCCKNFACMYSKLEDHSQCWKLLERWWVLMSWFGPFIVMLIESYVCDNLSIIEVPPKVLRSPN